MLGLSALRRGQYEEAGRWFDQLNADPETLRDVVVDPQRIRVLAPGEPFHLGS